MKKRIFMLALVVGVLLSMCASVWAADNGKYSMYSAQAEYKNIYKISARAGLTFHIRLRAKYNTGNGVSADVMQFVIVESTDSIFSGDLTITPVSASLPTDGSYVVAAELSGTLSDSIASNATGTVKVKAKLMYNNSDATGDSEAVTSKDAIIEFTAQDGTETRNTDFPAVSDDTTWDLNDMFETTEDDKANPDSDFWNGLDPTFTSDPGTNSEVKGKAKVTTSKLAFKSGTASTGKITITGPVTEVDVYIAAKDAAKLWPDSVDKKDDPIQLTKANIKKFSIPFRITEFDDSKNAGKLTGAAKTEKTAFTTDKNAAKTMTTVLTLAFNGANVAYKGFPITVSATNGEMSKPATKAVKIDVTPNTNVPGVYRYELTEFTDTVSIDLVSGSIIGVSADGVITSEDDRLDALTDNSVYNGTFTFLKMTSGDAYRYLSGDQVVASGDAATNVQYTYTYEKNAPVLYEKSKKMNWDIAVPLTAENEDDVGSVELTENPRVFYISGDAIAPYNITVKGEKNGVTATVTPPVYDNYGNLEEAGYVTIGGKLENTTKETKTGITITGTNPSTKKKGSVKINVIGKIPATFDKSKFEDAPTDYATPSYEDDYSDGAYKTVVKTKYVEAGKVPSAAFKAKGSKTITYEIVEGESDLTAAGLSFDVKKGKLKALTDKTKVVPTVDDEGNFAPVDLLVKATNGIEYLGEDGAQYARALIGVTGAKPAVYTKSVEFKKSDTVSGDYVNGTIKTFQLSAGKLKPAKPTDTAANIIATLADDSDTTLSDLGLELITYLSMDYVTSDEMWVTSGDTIFESGNADSADYIILSTDLTTSLDKDVWTTTDDDGNRVLSCDEALYDGAYGEDTENEGLKILFGSTTKTGDPDYRNLGIIRVTDYKKMLQTKKAVNLTLNNIGSEKAGKITVVIAETTSSSKESSARKTVAVDAAKAKTGTAGTAGSKFATALPDGAKAEAEAENAAEEAAVTVGAARTLADVTEAQKAFLAEKGYKVIAVLPEISATAEGQQDFEVELDEDAPEGEKMIYVPFPKDVAETEDDRIADFYDEAGAAIEEVPAGRSIVAAPWLRADVVYEPVIAVEAAAE